MSHPQSPHANPSDDKPRVALDNVSVVSDQDTACGLESLRSGIEPICKGIARQSELPLADKNREKLPGLDALRGLAALGVVLLHCCVPYMQPVVPGLAWSVFDHPHWLASQCFWFIEIFIMPVFLVLAGYFAWLSLKRGDIKRLVRSRARRLLVPLGFGVMVILPADLYIWLTGWVADGQIALRKMQSLKFTDGVDQDLWGLSHLWFLEYLFLYVLVLGIVFAICRRLPQIGRVFRSPLTCCSILFIAASCVLVVCPEVVWGFQHRFYPVPSKWFYSGAFFALGVSLASFDTEMRWLAKTFLRHSGYGVAMVIPAMLLGQWHLRGGDHDLASMMLALTTTASASLITVALLGAAASVRKPLSPSWRYLAAASFWIYLVHHPILGLMQIDMKWLFPELSSLIKVVIGFAGSVTLSLVTYEVWVRKTWLGRVLGFNYELNHAAALEQQPDERRLPDNDLQILSGSGRNVSTLEPVNLSTRRSDRRAA